jgi:hypothetical protein
MQKNGAKMNDKPKVYADTIENFYYMQEQNIANYFEWSGDEHVSLVYETPFFINMDLSCINVLKERQKRG